ncbi:MAG: GNAT family N-acetyltransferase [Oscillospiraceae bacterium]
MKTPILETERIILKLLSINDAKDIFNNWTSDPEVAKFMIWDLHKSVDDTIEWLKIEENNIMSDKNYTWAFVLKETGILFGSGGINYRDKEGTFELGYNIMKEYWNQGLTTEAGRAILEFAQNQLGEKKFFCRHAKENIGSMKVMTKLGFIYQKDSSYTSFSGKKVFESKDYLLET